MSHAHFRVTLISFGNKLNAPATKVMFLFVCLFLEIIFFKCLLSNTQKRKKRWKEKSSRVWCLKRQQNNCVVDEMH